MTSSEFNLSVDDTEDFWNTTYSTTVDAFDKEYNNWLYKLKHGHHDLIHDLKDAHAWFHKKASSLDQDAGWAVNKAHDRF